MKKYSIPLIVLTLALMAGCDKIDRNEYLTATGGNSAGSDWTNGGTQRALVEKYTGPRCINCPLADETLDALHGQYHDNLVIVAITPYDNTMADPFPHQLDPRTAVGTTWAEYFGISRLPAAYINRDQSTMYDGAMDNIGSAIGTVLAKEPYIDLSISATPDILTDDTVGHNVTIKVGIEVLKTIEGPFTFTLLMTEDSLVYRQSSPDGGVISDYPHNHILRDVLTSTWGEEIPLTGTAGEYRSKTYNYTVADSINVRNCNFVGFISRKNDRTVINCCQQSIR